MTGLQRKLSVLSVLIAVYLVVSVAPAQAASAELVVGSQHTSDTDFNNAETLTNLTVDGAGDSAVVTLDGDVVLDDFEDGDLSEWSTGSSWTIATDRTFEGDNAIKADGSGTSQADRDITARPYANLSWAVNVDTLAADTPQLGLRNGTTVGPRVRIDGSGNVLTFDGTSWGDTGIDVSADTWYEFELTSIDYGADTYTLTVYTADGSTVGSASGRDFEASISQIDNIRLFQFDTNVHWYDYFHYETQHPDSAQYVGANHSVENAEEAAINISNATNVSATLTVEYHDGSGWVEGNQTTVTTAANHTLTLPDVTSSTWRLNASVSKTGDNPAFELADESILFSDHAPTVDNASADPQGGDLVNADDVELSIDTNDSEFPTAQGENVTVTFKDASDDSTIGTDTLTANGTANVTWSDLMGGTHEWYAEAGDDYGLNTTSQTFSFETPSNLSIRDEQNPDELVNQSGTATVRFYSSDDVTVVERETSDGNISLAGLPTNDEFVVTIEVDGWHPRTILLDSLVDQQDAYLLNETTATTVDVVFVLDNIAGNFPADGSSIVVERALNRSGSTQWTTVAGDEFGGDSSFRVTLEEDARYRLTIENDDGDVKLLGSYTASQSESATLQPSSPTVTINESTGPFNWNATQINASGSERVVFDLVDTEDLTKDVELKIYERGNESNELHNQTYSGPFGNLSVTEPLSADQSETTWVVEWSATRDGEDISAKTNVGPEQREQVPDIPDDWRPVFGAALLFISAGVFSQLNAGTGGVVVAMEGGLIYWTGFLDGATTFSLVVIAIAIAVMYKYVREGV